MLAHRDSEDQMDNMARPKQEKEINVASDESNTVATSSSSFQSPAPVETFTAQGKILDLILKTITDKMLYHFVFLDSINQSRSIIFPRFTNLFQN